jgi:hypothetical protein
MERFTTRAFNPQPEPPALRLLLPAVQVGLLLPAVQAAR